MADWTIGPNGTLVYQGSGPAPYLSPDLQSQLRSTGGGATPAGAQYGVYSPSPGFAPIPLPGGSPNPATATTQTGGSKPATPTGSLVPFKPGPIQGIMSTLISQAIGGTSQPGPARTLNQLSQGIVPDALQAQYKQNLDRSMADITERMGLVGNRFGTDLSRTLAEAAGQANVNLSAEAIRNALAAIQEIMGGGTSQSQLEFQGGQAALDRAHQDYTAQNNSFLNLLPLLIGQG